MQEKIYKIYNPNTNLYSLGGMDLKWNKNGKIWKKIGDLKSHIVMVYEYHCLTYSEQYSNYIKQYNIDKFPYKNCVVIEYNIEDNATNAVISYLK